MGGRISSTLEQFQEIAGCYTSDQVWASIRVEHDPVIIFGTDKKLRRMCRILLDDFVKYCEDFVWIGTKVQMSLDPSCLSFA